MSKTRRATFLAIGPFASGGILVRSVRASRPRITGLEKIIDKTWKSVIGKPGALLFDAPLCRLESYSVGKKLVLVVGRASYRDFFGTNLNGGREIARRFGASALANAIGVSSVVESSDGYLLLGRRSRAVAHYGGRMHLFGGMLEPRRRLDVFEQARRELAEEINFAIGDQKSMVCLGLVRDPQLLQPELIFAVRCGQTRRQLLGKLDETEHESAVAIRAGRKSVAAAIANPALTPVAAAALLAWGKRKWGKRWNGPLD